MCSLRCYNTDLYSLVVIVLVERWRCLLVSMSSGIRVTCSIAITLLKYYQTRHNDAEDEYGLSLGCFGAKLR